MDFGVGALSDIARIARSMHIIMNDAVDSFATESFLRGDFVKESRHPLIHI
jgi:hypothetical protein